jgi:type I restriction enzyme R subunit
MRLTKSQWCLRPYQFYAVEALIDRVKNSNKNGYIWHTTGSGKTLTSFKASQILMTFPRKFTKWFLWWTEKIWTIKPPRSSTVLVMVALTEQTTQPILVKQFIGTYKDIKRVKPKTAKLIVTTIQKLNTAISKLKYEKKMADSEGQANHFHF